MWASVSLQVLHRLMPSTWASALALRQASPSLLFCSVSLRPCTFAVYLSHLCWAKADRRFGVGGPSPKPLRLETIASMSSRDRIVPRRVPAASHSARRWLPQQSTVVVQGEAARNNRKARIHTTGGQRTQRRQKQKVRGGSGGGVEGWRVDMSKGNMVFVHTFSSSIQTW